jgi:predicted site-specific integrase-resolvase
MAVKISTYAKNNDLCYRTVYNYFKKGLLRGITLPSGTILIEDDLSVEDKIVVYYEKSSEKITDFCNTKGWNIDKIIKGNSLDNKKLFFLELLKDISITKIITEDLDIFSFFNLKIIKQLLETQKRELIIIN